MIKYACEICGYEYDPEHGDIDNDIAEGIDFDELPADWVCPECGAPKDDFTPVPDFSDDEEEEEE